MEGDRIPLTPDPDSARWWKEHNAQFTEAELEANKNPGAPMEPEVTHTPAFPSWLTTLAKFVGGLAGTALVALSNISIAPPWAAFALFCVVSVCGFILGVNSPSPFAGKPILTGTALTVVATIGGYGFTLASALPEGTFKHVSLFVVAIAFAAAGKALPIGQVTK